MRRWWWKQVTLWLSCIIKHLRIECITVDGAIHAAAGHELKEACELPRLYKYDILCDDDFCGLGRALYPDGCDTGDAKITEAYNLPSCVNLGRSVIEI